MKRIKKIAQYGALALLAGQLTACETIGIGNKDSDAKDPATTVSERVDNAIEKATITASKDGSTTANLIALERQYKRNSANPKHALAYARGLRQNNFLKRAAMVLSPFADSANGPEGIKTEMSMIELGLGNYNTAEKYAQAAIVDNPEDYQAYQNLGIALDAKKMHTEAERAFRKGLQHWQGNPTTIMNNLALNLATQGFIDEAVEILERAKDLSPNRIEIERNLRIIRTLNER